MRAKKWWKYYRHVIEPPREPCHIHETVSRRLISLLIFANLFLSRQWTSINFSFSPSYLFWAVKDVKAGNHKTNIPLLTFLWRRWRCIVGYQKTWFYFITPQLIRWSANKRKIFFGVLKSPFFFSWKVTFFVMFDLCSTTHWIISRRSFQASSPKK